MSEVMRLMQIELDARRDKIREQEQTITQQVQELERMKELSEIGKLYPALSCKYTDMERRCLAAERTLSEWGQQLAAMTTERDNWETSADEAMKGLKETREQLAASQARCREMERDRCGDCGSSLINQCLACGAPVCCPKCCQVDQLQATLAAREARITELEDQMNAKRYITNEAL